MWKLQGKPLRLAEELHPRLRPSPPTPALQGDGGTAAGSRVPAAGARLCWERAGGPRQFELTTPHLPWAKGITVCRLPSAATL